MAPRLPTSSASSPRRRRRQLGRFFPGIPLASRIEALPDLGLVYVRNPKVATSTLLDWLDWMNSGQLRSAADDFRRDNSLPKPRDVGWERVMRMLDGEAFRFSFVRSPVTRFESAYRSKILQPTPSRAEVLHQLGRPGDASEEISFDDFLSAAEQQDPLHADIHWRPQHLNLMHPLLVFDHLGRLETFDRDIEVIRESVGLPSPPARSRNVSSGGRPSVYEGRPDLLRRVEELFATDMELYGY